MDYPVILRGLLAFRSASGGTFCIRPPPPWLPDGYRQIVCVWPFGLEGLWLRCATLQNLIPSFPWITPGWRGVGAQGKDQILPSGDTVCIRPPPPPILSSLILSWACCLFGASGAMAFSREGARSRGPRTQSAGWLNTPIIIIRGSTPILSFFILHSIPVAVTPL